MNPVTFSAAASTQTPTLSDSVILTLTIEGPSPLVVSVPAEIASPASLKNWKIVPSGPARLTPQGVRETWVQRYRLDPYTPGESLALDLSAFTVQYGPEAQHATVIWPDLTFRVTTQIPVQLPPPQGITSIEPAPEPPAIPGPGWPWPLLPAGLLVGGTLLVLALRRGRRRSAQPPPPEVVFEQALLAAVGPAAERARAVVAALRRFVSARYGLAAEPLTHRELLAALPSLQPLHTVLERLEALEFGGADCCDAEWVALRSELIGWARDESTVSKNLEPSPTPV